MTKDRRKDELDPSIHPVLDEIPDTPENIAKAILSTPPKREEEWDYLKKFPKGRTR